MSCSPEELLKRSTALAAGWQAFLAAPGTDPLLEFAVSLSSFTEFLHGKGLSGLNQVSRSLEQQTLALLDIGPDATIAPATLADLDQRVQELGVRVSDFIDSQRRPVMERRAQTVDPSMRDVAPLHRVWLVGSSGAAWQELALQLGYFNIDAEFHQIRNLPGHGDEPAIVLLNAGGLSSRQTVEQVQQLRERFAASTLLVHELAGDFDSLRAALSAGSDFCFPAGTAQPLILAKLIELCSGKQEAPYRALVVEDSITASKSIQRTLAMCDIETHAIANPHEVLDCLAQFQPDLILMDMFMPGCTGVEAARVIRQHPEFLSIPIVYLSGDTNVPLQIEALRLGGDHFLTKPYNPVVLNAIVQSKIERYRELRRAMERDSLTGLYNHRTSKDKLATAIQQARSTQQALAVAMIDIDHFKKINDGYGHPMGDQVIRSLSWFLSQRLRKTDIIGRYGGEEFLVVLPAADTPRAVEVLDRIRHDFGQIKHPFNETWCTATLSAGVTQLHETDDAQALIKQADEALYSAKRAGRNRIVSWE
ncbi:MAG: diguanylate cyclase [Hylemonella sp.]|nr:diguanylate cyclase [Hylemonella sp.]